MTEIGYLIACQSAKIPSPKILSESQLAQTSLRIFWREKLQRKIDLEHGRTFDVQKFSNPEGTNGSEFYSCIIFLGAVLCSFSR